MCFCKGCKILKNKNKKNNITDIKNRYGVIYSFCEYPSNFSILDELISQKRFKNEVNLDFIEFSNILKKIEENAFEDCEKLKFISYKVFQEAFESEKQEKLVIQKEAFLNCVSLETVILPSVKYLVIEKNAFENCKSLRTLILDFDDSGYLDIHPLAFSGCEKLTILTKSEKIMTYCRNNGVNYFDAN